MKLLNIFGIEAAQCGLTVEHFRCKCKCIIFGVCTLLYQYLRIFVWKHCNSFFYGHRCMGFPLLLVTWRFFAGSNPLLLVRRIFGLSWLEILWFADMLSNAQIVGLRLSSKTIRVAGSCLGVNYSFVGRTGYGIFGILIGIFWYYLECIESLKITDEDWSPKSWIIEIVSFSKFFGVNTLSGKTSWDKIFGTNSKFRLFFRRMIFPSLSVYMRKWPKYRWKKSKTPNCVAAFRRSQNLAYRSILT